jgi:hypothetical protein
MDEQQRQQEIARLEDYLAEHADEIKIADASLKACMRWAKEVNIRDFEGQWVAFYNGKLIGSCVSRNGLCAMLQSMEIPVVLILFKHVPEGAAHAHEAARAAAR